MIPDAHLVLYTLATVLSAWSVSLIVRGVVGERNRSKRQCPVCGAGVPSGRTCPSCDYEAARENELFGRKRSFWMVVGGTLAMTLGAVAWFFGRHMQRMALDPWEDLVGVEAFSAVAFGLVLTGLFTTFRGFRGDRSRGRKRCPKCWYDMTGAPSLTCPECGHASKSDRGLYRPRRRRFVMVLGVFVLCSSLIPYEFSRVQRGGWVAAIPTTALVVGMPWWPEDAIQWGLDDAEENWSLASRIDEDSIWFWHRWILKGHCRALVNTDDYRKIDRGIIFFEMFDEEAQTALLQTATNSLARILISDDPIARLDAAGTLLDFEYNLIAEELCREAALPIIDELTAMIRVESNPFTIGAAASLLGQCGEDAEDSVQTLVDAIHRYPQNGRVVLPVGIALSYLSDDLVSAKLALIDLFHSDDPEIVKNAISGPRYAKNTSAFYDELLLLLGHDDKWVAVRAASALQSVTDKTDMTVAAIAAQIGPEGGGRTELISALILYGEAARPYYPLVLALISSPDEERRVNATEEISYFVESIQGDLTPFLEAARSVLNRLSPTYPDYEEHKVRLEETILELESHISEKMNGPQDDG